MPKLTKLLRVYKVKSEEYGEIIELYSPRNVDGRAAYFVDEEEIPQRSSTRPGETEFVTVQVGVGLRLTKKTALKLAEALMKLAKEKK